MYELKEYLKFSKIKNIFLESKSDEKHQLVSGRAILSRMEGEFTRLNQIYGNQIIFLIKLFLDVNIFGTVMFGKQLWNLEL